MHGQKNIKFQIYVRWPWKSSLNSGNDENCEINEIREKGRPHYLTVLFRLLVYLLGDNFQLL